MTNDFKVKTRNGLELTFEVDGYEINVASENTISEASFSYNEAGGYIYPDSVDVSEERQGIYTAIVDALLFNDELKTILREEIGEDDLVFASILRTEQACAFWSARGYFVEYDEEEHENGEQEEIRIAL